MNILVIGNGFDLAHGLPTGYKHFLKYCREYQYKGETISAYDSINNEFSDFLEHNVWLRYFEHIYKSLGVNWIDFEKEVSEALRKSEKYWGKSIYDVDNKVINVSEPESILLTGVLNCNQYFRDEESLYIELRKFTRAFELYCFFVINNLPCTFRSSSPTLEQYDTEMMHIIEDISRDKYKDTSRRKDILKKYPDHRSLELPVGEFLYADVFDYVLSFNYTNTYERIYDRNIRLSKLSFIDTEYVTNADLGLNIIAGNVTQYCYIHGKAQSDKDNTNLIFGIDDYLSRDQANNNFIFAQFKKYFQRIFFKTGSEYKDWIRIISDNSNQSVSKATHFIHIVGHSLDRTDHDVFAEFFAINRENVKIIVYYYNQVDYVDKIQKITNIIGKDSLIRRVHGSNWTIKFVDQYDETYGLFKKNIETPMIF